MIPLYRLQKLPLVQSRLKSVKMFREAENKILSCGTITEKELVYLLDVLKFCITLSNTKSREALEKISKDIEHSLLQPKTSSLKHSLRYSLNNIQHILLSEMGRYPSEWDFDKSDLNGALDQKKRRVFPRVQVYLEDIRSPFNVGAIFRTAESFGVEKILLSPFCADPEHQRAKRTAMGCVSIMPWERLENELFPVAPSKDDSLPVFALETGGINPEEFPFPAQGIMIVGSEELGVSPLGLEMADASLGRLSIPIFGAKGSLNVSVAFGIAMHAWAMKISEK